MKKTQLCCNCSIKYRGDQSFIIKIVKMKYNLIDIEWCIDSNSFKKRPCNSFILYITFTIVYYIVLTIFYYNIISLKRIFCSCSSQRPLSNRIIQFTCNAVSTHLNHRRIFLFFTSCGVVLLLSQHRNLCA